MICKRCGNILRENATVCDQCGAEVEPRVRAAGRRQGRTEPEEGRLDQERFSYAAEDAAGSKTGREKEQAEAAGRPHVHRSAPRPTEAAERTVRTRKHAVHPVRRVMVNWAMLFAFLFVLLIMAAVGGYVFLKVTDTGQLILARMGRDADATALWTYGQELLDQGHVARAIATYEKAYEMDPEREDIYTRLIQLADAYEAAGRTSDAERVYTTMYTKIDKENTYAYTEITRIMENQGRRLELSSFLKLAYENTKDNYFRRQREDLLPSVPTASEEAGSRKSEQDVKLISAEDYDIYYLFGDEGTLPEDGQLYTKPIHLAEGSYILRAVAVSSDLISDEMRITYSISLPTPLGPGISLAPGTYERRQRIWLRHIESEDEHLSNDPKLKDVTIYYTVDGQTPTSNSPIFTGEPFYLPAGSCTLKAVAVNGYGKVSNILERTYKINIPFKKYFSEADSFQDFTIMKTTRDAFVKKFGNPKSEKSISDGSAPGDATQLTYDWGYARFTTSDVGNVIYAFETNASSIKGPRKTTIGMAEADVTALFRDMGQTYDQNGDRSIYYDTAVKCYAKLYHLSKTEDRLDYSYTREDKSVVTLSYTLEKGKVRKMRIACKAI